MVAPADPNAAPLSFPKTFASSAIAACTAEVGDLRGEQKH